MQTSNESCHGIFECLQAGSNHRVLSRILRPWQKVRSYAGWHFENLGWSKGLKGICQRICHGKSAASSRPDQEGTYAGHEVLALQSGEWVEVRPIEEILATLDGNRRHRGLLWMSGMRKYCGGRYRVHQRVERIMLETNGELRKMKNTVLLEGAMCDGKAFSGCDRSCFHFWREVWLRRVPETADPENRRGQSP